MRHTLAYLIATTFITVSSTGCILYFGDDGDDDCLYGGGGTGAEPAPLPGVRNPVTGQCEYHYGGGGGGGGGGCDSTCGTCEPVPAEPAPGALPSWGYCDSECSYLDEGTCLATAGCRAAYMDDFGYFECWSVDMSGPVQGGQCAGLDAWECSRHDDCVAWHANTCSGDDPTDPSGDIACGIGAFRECAAEPGADPGLCHGQVDCTALPPGCPPNSVAGRRDGCWTGACILVEQCEPAWCEDIADEQTCKSRSDCVARYEGSDCTCDASGNCTCGTWTFTSCATAQPDPIDPA
jgi:hypothetical protein